jgi:hypothetical protein
MLSSVFQLVILIHVIILNIKIKIVKLVKFHVISGVVSYKSCLCLLHLHNYLDKGGGSLFRNVHELL